MKRGDTRRIGDIVFTWMVPPHTRNDRGYWKHGPISIRSFGKAGWFASFRSEHALYTGTVGKAPGMALHSLRSAMQRESRVLERFIRYRSPKLARVRS